MEKSSIIKSYWSNISELPCRGSYKQVSGKAVIYPWILILLHQHVNCWCAYIEILVSSRELFNKPSLICPFGAKDPLMYCCWLHRTKFYASHVPENHAIGLLITGNTIPGLTTFISNCIVRINLYEYRENFMNPWTLHVNKTMFKLVKPLWWYGAFADGVI